MNEIAIYHFDPIHPLEMASGIATDPRCNELWKQFQGSGHKWRSITFYVKDRKMVVPEDDSWQIPIDNSKDEITDTNDVIMRIKKKLVGGNRPRWVIVHACYPVEGGIRTTGKNVLIKFLPETSPIKEKMIFASSNKGFLDSFNPSWSGAAVQCDDLDEIDDIVPSLMNGSLKG